MAITDATIYTETWLAIRGVLVGASITDASSNAVTVSAAYSDKGPIKPQVVIQPIIKNEVLDKFGSNEGKKNITVVIDCFHQDTKNVETMSQQVEAALKGNTIAGIELEDIDTDWAFNSPGNNKYFLKTVTAGYLRE